MTDLVFLLLIFFIIISTLVSNGVNVDLPTSKGTTSVTPNLTLSITADGTYHLNEEELSLIQIWKERLSWKWKSKLKRLFTFKLMQKFLQAKL